MPHRSSQGLPVPEVSGRVVKILQPWADILLTKLSLDESEVCAKLETQSKGRA
jgi:hypothetical protein